MFVVNYYQIFFLRLDYLYFKYGHPLQKVPVAPMIWHKNKKKKKRSSIIVLADENFVSRVISQRTITIQIYYDFPRLKRRKTIIVELATWFYTISFLFFRNYLSTNIILNRARRRVYSYKIILIINEKNC